MKWFRLYTEILDDPKIQRLSDSEFRDFIYLMCVACEVEKNGSIPLSSEDIAWRIRRDHNSLLLSIKTLKRFHVTVSCNANETLMKHSNETHNETLHNDGIHFINWNKRQFKRDNSSERVRRYRDKKKHETPCNGYMKRDVTPLEQNRDRDIKEVGAPAPPSLETKEDLTESSIPRIKQALSELTEKLYREKTFIDAPKFKNQMLKQGKNPRAILHALIRCDIKKPGSNEAWGYCLQIMKVEDGNYNERDSTKTC